MNSVSAATGQATGKSPRIDFIDSLRGGAIAGVVMVHVGQVVDGLPGWLRSFAAYGGNGVELFFMLSALTLVSIYRDRGRDPRAFFIRRFFRIAPMFYVGAAFYLLMWGTGPQLPYSPDGISPATILLTFAFLHGWSPAAFNSVVPGGWSIANEAMFYLLFPLLLGVLTNPRRALLAFSAAFVLSRATFVFVPVMLAGGTYESYPIKTYAAFLFPAQLVAFLGGFVVYYLMGKTKFMPENLKTPALLVVIGCIFAVAASGNKSLTNYLLADLLFVPFILLVQASHFRFLVNSVLQYIGKVSFSVYIVHFFFVRLVHQFALPGLGEVMAPALLFLAAYGLVFALSILVATLTYRWIELPGISLGKMLSRSPAVPYATDSGGG